MCNTNIHTQLLSPFFQDCGQKMNSSFGCPVCHKGFRSPKFLTVHVGTFHGISRIWIMDPSKFVWKKAKSKKKVADKYSSNKPRKSEIKDLPTVNSKIIKPDSKSHIDSNNGDIKKEWNLELDFWDLEVHEVFSYKCYVSGKKINHFCHVERHIIDLDYQCFPESEAESKTESEAESEAESKAEWNLELDLEVHGEEKPYKCYVSDEKISNICDVPKQCFPDNVLMPPQTNMSVAPKMSKATPKKTPTPTVPKSPRIIKSNAHVKPSSGQFKNNDMDNNSPPYKYVIMEVHEGKEQYKCELCNVKFINLCDVQKHLMDLNFECFLVDNFLMPPLTNMGEAVLQEVEISRHGLL